MKIILRKDFEHLGNAGDIKEVKNGYARNFLIPQGIAYNAATGAVTWNQTAYPTPWSVFGTVTQ